MSASPSIERPGFGTFRKNVVVALKIGAAALGVYLMAAGFSVTVVTLSTAGVPFAAIGLSLLALAGADHPSRGFAWFARGTCLFMVAFIMWRQEMFSLSIWRMIATFYF